VSAFHFVFSEFGYSGVSVIRLSVVRPSRLYVHLTFGIVSSTILYMALYGRLLSLVRPSQFHVQIFESRLGRITEISLYYGEVNPLS